MSSDPIDAAPVLAECFFCSSEFVPTETRNEYCSERCKALCLARGYRIVKIPVRENNCLPSRSMSEGITAGEAIANLQRLDDESLMTGVAIQALRDNPARQTQVAVQCVRPVLRDINLEAELNEWKFMIPVFLYDAIRAPLLEQIKSLEEQVIGAEFQYAQLRCSDYSTEDPGTYEEFADRWRNTERFRSMI